MSDHIITGPAQVYTRPVDPRDGNEWKHLGEVDAGVKLEDIAYGPGHRPFDIDGECEELDDSTSGVGWPD